MEENKLKILSAELAKREIDFSRGCSVASRSTFGVGGKAELAVFPKSTEELIAVLDLVCDLGVRHQVLGNCSNTLFAFDGGVYDGVLIFTGKLMGIRAEGERIYADCGTSLIYLSGFAGKKSLEGLEFAFGIPGLVGGSVYMNSGAYGSSLSEVIESTEAYDTQKRKRVVLTDHEFGYRKSIYEENKHLVCLSACFLLKKGNEEDIRKRMRENMRQRQEKQPIELRSAGSYFKRPEGCFAGKLIEDCGLKGFSVGDARVSEKHAGFIVNTGNATAEDILALEEIIKEKVLDRFGVTLEREVRLIK